MAGSESMNQAQQEAINHIYGPLLILAGAGAGKTRTIVHRIRNMVRRGIDPRHILAVTFTNKAASEMKERVRALLMHDPVLGRPIHESDTPFISTFHALGLLLIKENSKLLGYQKALRIYDRADSLRVVKDALKKTGLEEIDPRSALSRISRFKSDGVDLFGASDLAESPFDSSMLAVWRLYAQALREDNGLDFDDLLCVAVSLLKQHEDLRKKYQSRWQYIHVDEYQDTNHIQEELLRYLIGPQQHVCVVGDIDQTIYSWRGAKIANILSFEKRYGDAKVVLLEENYRSTKTILAAANDVIAKNIFRQEKNLYTNNTQGDPIMLYQAYDETDEGAFVARTLKELFAKGIEPKDCAVLYRANFQSRAVEEQLLAASISYQVLGTRFFERKEVKDALSYARAALTGSMVDIARIANTPVRGIGKVTLMKMLTHREEELPHATQIKLSGLYGLLQRIREAAGEVTSSQLMRLIITESGLEMTLQKDVIEGAERLENLRELVSLAARYDQYPLGEGLDLFLTSAALSSEQDELKEETNAVRLMTIHAAKGLEFPYVFIIGLEEGLFPYSREGENEVDREEERRLMYVALTRAKVQVYLSLAARRTIFGSQSATEPSQFLSDIPDHLIEWGSPLPSERAIYLD